MLRNKSVTFVKLFGKASIILSKSLLQFFNHLSFLFFKMVAQNLWNQLSETTPSNHQRSVELFQQLHQVTPNSWVCEDVIGSALIGDGQVSRNAVHFMWFLFSVQHENVYFTEKPFNFYSKGLDNCDKVGFVERNQNWNEVKSEVWEIK